jgi:hypothetical protein
MAKTGLDQDWPVTAFLTVLRLEPLKKHDHIKAAAVR